MLWVVSQNLVEMLFLVTKNLEYPDLLRMRMLSTYFLDFIDNHPLMSDVKDSKVALYKNLQRETREAYMENDIDRMRNCLERGVSPNIYFKYRNYLHKQNMFSDFCCNGDIICIRLFLEYDANINIQRNYDNDRTPLLLACNEGNVEVVKILIENGADVNLIDRNGTTPLMTAVSSGNIDIVEILLMNALLRVFSNIAQLIYIILSFITQPRRL